MLRELSEFTIPVLSKGLAVALGTFSIVGRCLRRRERSDKRKELTFHDGQASHFMNRLLSVSDK